MNLNTSSPEKTSIRFEFSTVLLEVTLPFKYQTSSASSKEIVSILVQMISRPSSVDVIMMRTAKSVTPNFVSRPLLMVFLLRVMDQEKSFQHLWKRIKIWMIVSRSKNSLPQFIHLPPKSALDRLTITWLPVSVRWNATKKSVLLPSREQSLNSRLKLTERRNVMNKKKLIDSKKSVK